MDFRGISGLHNRPPWQEKEHPGDGLAGRQRFSGTRYRRHSFDTVLSFHGTGYRCPGEE